MLEINYKAMEWCIARRVPFCVYRRPEDRVETFHAAPSLTGNLLPEREPDPSDGEFFISPFNGRWSSRLTIPRECGAETLLRHRMRLAPGPERPLWTVDTDPAIYIAHAIDAVKRIKDPDTPLAKVVLSVTKTLCLPLTPAARYAANLIDYPGGCFRHCYYHPATGFWMGATPELLLSCDMEDASFRTMALASTVSGPTRWDDKDVNEQRIVSEHVGRTLAALGLEYKESNTRELRYHNLAHRCNEFDGSLGDVTPDRIIDALNPTPAVAGYPVPEALEAIAGIERHPRLCYAGYVGVSTVRRLDAYVNIRCVNFDKSQYTVYTGGGLVSESVPRNEWDEVCAKRQALCDIMNIEKPQNTHIQ